MISALFDTCILIDYLNGVPAAQSLLDAAFANNPAISQITWIEVLVGVSPETEAGTRGFLGRFKVLQLDDPVSEEAVKIRRAGEANKKKPKLPDAIILATARKHDRVLVTRNTKDFPNGMPGVTIPYLLSLP
jgi:hypothetical protein